MRRAGPALIVLIGILALIIDFFPGLRLPDFAANDGSSRLVETKLGLDLEGGLRVEYQALPKDGVQPSREALGVIKDIIERRVNTTGVSEPVVVVQGDDRVVIELPGISDVDSVRRLVGQTGRLDFVPLGTTQVQEGQTIDLKEFPPLFSGDQLESAAVGQDQQGGGLTVTFVLKNNGPQSGAQLFAKYTAEHIGQYFAIVLDGSVISAPVIRGSIPNGQVEISAGNIGGFPAKEANSLVTVLKFGSLPFPIKEVSSEQISATLGEQFLNQSLIAGFIGIALVITFMLLYYRLPGLIAAFALIYYTIVVLAIFRLIPVTLTLAGIAGFVLSVGMAVDANILIFERMKEELRVGKSLPAAVEAGFNRAWNSILDSNVSSLITATILYALGSSVIRGFALVLIIGVLTSMFSAIVVTRSIMRVLVRQDWARRARLFGLRDEEFVAVTPQRPQRRALRADV
ncbi:MAG TPA: protein translocase subunit SecD [Candidatus Limnocylindrales bacterium]|jgi:preprotein translocase subunit SecD|nr:protein translocase subunit SecD [Candidatus Limnocylindrales bacterium]